MAPRRTAASADLASSRPATPSPLELDAHVKRAWRRPGRCWFPGGEAEAVSCGALGMKGSERNAPRRGTAQVCAPACTQARRRAAQARRTSVRPRAAKMHSARHAGAVQASPAPQNAMLSQMLPRAVRPAAPVQCRRPSRCRCSVGSAVSSTPWWTAHSALFTDVRDAAGLEALLTTHKDKVVVLEWLSPTCKVCCLRRCGGGTCLQQKHGLSRLSPH